MATNHCTETGCPLCGGDNRCAVAAGAAVQQCWCSRQPVHAAAIARLPAQAVGAACLCPDCARVNGGSTLAR